MSVITCSVGRRTSKQIRRFLNDDIYSQDEALAPELLAYFKLPEYLLADVYRKSNGFFDSEVEHDDDGRLVAFCTRSNHVA
jgi:hypothetical protein